MLRPTPKVPVTSKAATDPAPGASSWQTIKRVGPYLWPEGETWVKRRVVLSMIALVAAKLVSITTPFMYKFAVDALTGKAPSVGLLLAVTAVGLTVAYGMARLLSVGFGELRDAIFVRVG